MGILTRETGIDVLTILICDDKKEYKYRTEKELKALFYGLKDSDDNIMDVEEIWKRDERRLPFTVNCLKEIGFDGLKKVVERIIDAKNFESTILKEKYVGDINNVLNIENLEVVKNKTEYIFQKRK